MTITAEVFSGDDCGEAATWCPDDSCVYWTDVNRFLVHRYNISTSETRTWQFDEPCVALALTDRPGTLLLARASSIVAWRPNDSSETPYGFDYPAFPAARLNDGRAGPNGEFVIGSMYNNVGEDGQALAVNESVGELFRLKSSEAPKRLKRNIGISNTVCFSPDRKFLYFGDTLQNCIWRYDYDGKTGAISNETEFFKGFDRGLPDGSAIDADGCLWNCRFGGACIVKVTPSGEIDAIVEMPVSNITTCEFGGPELATLYITTARIELEKHERLAGSLFSVRPGVRGVTPLRVALGAK